MDRAQRVAEPTAIAARAESGFQMRLVVDLNRCQGFAQCVFLAPDIFALHGDEALLFSPRFDEAQRDRVKKAAAACPVQAILVDYSDEPTRGVEPHVG
jgi:ferredoxin